LSIEINIKSIQRFKLERIPDLLQLSYITGLQKDRALFFSSGLHPVHGRFTVLSLNPLFSIDENFDDLLKTLFSYRPFRSLDNIPLPVFSGWMNYECNRFVEKIESSLKTTVAVPDFHFVFSDSFIVIDNFEKKAELVLLETNYSTVSVDERKTAIFKSLPCRSLTLMRNLVLLRRMLLSQRKDMLKRSAR